MTDAMEKPPLRIKSVAAWDHPPVTQNLALESSFNNGNDCRQKEVGFKADSSVLSVNYSCDTKTGLALHKKLQSTFQVDWSFLFRQRGITKWMAQAWLDAIQT